MAVLAIQLPGFSHQARGYREIYLEIWRKLHWHLAIYVVLANPQRTATGILPIEEPYAYLTLVENREPVQIFELFGEGAIIAFTSGHRRRR